MLSLRLIALVSFFFLIALCDLPAIADSCNTNEYYDTSMAMCMPLPTSNQTRASLQGNFFLVQTTETGPRGRTSFYSPNFFMADIGTTWLEHHYLNLDYMGTVERWTVPDAGYPELLQIGEETNYGIPYLDAQHPHSTPVMGLTLSDTWDLGRNKDNLKLFFSPRGESTDGPVAFMHRPTGMANPDAPLGHHVGQDVGHISSTVLGESLTVGTFQIEASTFNGIEPQPQNVDLPMGHFNSYAFRVTENLLSGVKAMISYAYVSNPEIDAPSITFVNRYSASVYDDWKFDDDWSFDNALIWGAISNYDYASILNSFTEEFLIKKNRCHFWGRVEGLERTPAELQISTNGDPNMGQWVFALTLGYTHTVSQWTYAELGLGASVTTDFLPNDYQGVYAGNPWAAKIFLQLTGLKNFKL